MRLLLAALLIFVSCFSYASDKDSADTSGDILRALIPAVAYGSTFYNDDAEGRKQFYKSFALNVGSTYALKETVVKERPDHSGNDSFPSGHASMAFQGAAFMQKRYGYQYGIPAYAAAIYTGWTRLYTDKHSETDVLAGMVIGIGSSLLFTTDSRVAVTPALSRGFYGVRMAMKW